MGIGSDPKCKTLRTYLITSPIICRCTIISMLKKICIFSTFCQFFDF